MPLVPDVDAAGGLAAADLVAVVEELLRAWDAEPPRVLRSGDLGVRDLRRAAGALELDDRRAATVLGLLLDAGLVADDHDPDPAFRLTPLADAFLAAGLARRWALLVRTWWRSDHVGHLVGTPGRVIDHLKKGTLDLSGLRHLVLDEADEMLAMGFQEDVERILSETPKEKQVALFSATMPPAIRKISKKYLHDPVEVTVKAKTATASNITQRYLQVAHQRKLDALTRLLEVEEFDGMIIFVRTKSATEELAEKLRARGFKASAINGDIPQQARERTVVSSTEMPSGLTPAEIDGRVDSLLDVEADLIRRLRHRPALH